uniref:ARID DNA-binding domain-containing protein n=1 Tax=Tanacetum cinerariifolium TaxID=118510 RepID=A0A6L2KQ02_TANCI|nr:ARID DNA-binding domain-containing protein [Tanacetum cinerariifolium]
MKRRGALGFEFELWENVKRIGGNDFPPNPLSNILELGHSSGRIAAPYVDGTDFVIQERKRLLKWAHSSSRIAAPDVKFADLTLLSAKEGVPIVYNLTRPLRCSFLQIGKECQANQVLSNPESFPFELAQYCGFPPAPLEKQLIEVLFRVAEYLTSIQVPFELAADKVLEQLTRIMKADNVKPTSDKMKFATADFTAIDVHIADIHSLLLNLREALSNEWEEHRDKFNRVLTWFFNHFLMRPLPGSLPPIIKGVSIHLFDLYELIESMGGYISVQFEGDFEGLAEILGLKRSDGMDIRRCYLDYLEPLVSTYKAARSSNPARGYEDEGIRRFKDYHGDGNMDGSTAAKEKGRVEHFGITLKEEGKYDAAAHQDEIDMARIKCYLCQRTGHFDFECPKEDQRPTNGASTSRQQGEEDTHSSSGDDFIIIV